MVFVMFAIQALVKQTNKMVEKIIEDENFIREHDRLLPIANVTRIMKTGVPRNAKISKNAKETIQLCSSEFISFISSEASDRCLVEKRKTITGEDLINALENLGFDNYANLIKLHYSKYKKTGKL